MTAEEKRLIEANTKLVDKNRLLQRDIETLEKKLNIIIEYAKLNGSIDKTVLKKIIRGEKYE